MKDEFMRQVMIGVGIVFVFTASITGLLYLMVME